VSKESEAVLWQLTGRESPLPFYEGGKHSSNNRGKEWPDGITGKMVRDAQSRKYSSLISNAIISNHRTLLSY